MTKTRRSLAGLTLIEMLVVMAIIAVLAGMVIPILTLVQTAGRRSACVSNLRQIGSGIMAYAGDHDGILPYGPKAPPMMGLSSLYPSTGAPTSLISMQGGKTVALGLLLDQYLSRTPKVFFCPGADQPVDMGKELAKVGKAQAQSSYYYRHAGNTMMYDDWSMTAAEPPNMRLANLGNNRKGKPIRALVLDTMFRCAPGLSQFGVSPKTNHKSKWVNALYVDGHVSTLQNRNSRFTVDLQNSAQLSGAFSAILDVFEKADEEP